MVGTLSSIAVMIVRNAVAYRASSSGVSDEITRMSRVSLPLSTIRLQTVFPSHVAAEPNKTPKKSARRGQRLQFCQTLGLQMEETR